VRCVRTAMSQPLPHSVLRQAAEWLVRLDHEGGAANEPAFRAWLAADPQHPQAIARLQGHLLPLKQAPARAALRRARPPRHAATLVKCLALALLLAGVPAYQYEQRGYLFADLSTGRSEWHQTLLADGSDLQLEGNTAVNLHLDASQRRVQLLHGEMLVTVAKDAQRPFYVDTPQGSIRALGTRFIVELSDTATVVKMLESSTRIDSAGHTITLGPGEQVRLDASGPGTPKSVDVQAQQQAWEAHQLLANDEPLADVLERLARHRPGVLMFDRKALQGMRVTVMLPTDDSDRALRLLSRTLPIEVSTYTPWLTRVRLKVPAE